MKRARTAASSADAAAGREYSDRLKGAAIGAGYFSRFQYEAWSRIPEVEIAAICDRTEEKARAMMAQFGDRALLPDWREMIDRERPDFVDIITPPETHEEMCAYAAARGVHIICQKPLAPSLEAAPAHRRNGARCRACDSWCMRTGAGSPGTARSSEIQRPGAIGDFTHLHFLMRMGDGWGENAYLDRQPFFRDYPRLLVYETGVHFIDTFRYLLGEVTEVYAHLRRLNPVIRGEETGQVFLRFRSGATAIWDANRYNEGGIAFAAVHVRPDAHRCDGRASDAGHGGEPPRSSGSANRLRRGVPARERQFRGAIASMRCSGISWTACVRERLSNRAARTT